jgi:transposase
MKAFDADAFIAVLNDRAILPVIPSKSNRKTSRPCDFVLDREGNLVERFFNMLKHFRAIATRYDKLAKIFLAGVHLACAGKPAKTKGFMRNEAFRTLAVSH